MATRCSAAATPASAAPTAFGARDRRRQAHRGRRAVDLSPAGGAVDQGRLDGPRAPALVRPPQPPPRLGSERRLWLPARTGRPRVPSNPDALLGFRDGRLPPRRAVARLHQPLERLQDRVLPGRVYALPAPLRVPE